MLLLPYHGHREWVRSFWLVLAFWSGLVAGLALPGGLAERGVMAAVAAVLVGAVPVVRPREARSLYRFSARALRFYSRFAHAALLALCYGIVFVAVGAGGSALRLRRPPPGESLWEPGRTLPVAAYRSQHEAPSSEGRRWRAILAWAAGSGNAWALALVPFLLLVTALDTEDETPYPVGIYTLF